MKTLYPSDNDDTHYCLTEKGKLLLADFRKTS